MSTALVTGASSGIGFELTKQLVGRGYTVFGIGATERVLDLPARLPGADIQSWRADLTVRADVDRAWAAFESTGQSLDVAILNAGVTLGGSFVETDIDEELRMIALNVTSQVILAKHVVRKMADQGFGRVLITSSVSATTPTPYESIYGPTRAFMLSFAEGLREELRGLGVSVTALLPGATATEFHQRGRMGGVFGDNSWKNDPALVAEQGLRAMFRGDDLVVAGNLATKWSALRNKFTPESSKARRFARESRPSPNQ